MTKKITTKERIINASLSLFNQEGIKNVRLQHIADSCGLSVGNLAYHYPDMKRILLALDRKIELDIAKTAFDWQSSSHFIDFDNKLIQYFHMMNKYSFYFLDAIEIERSYPSLHDKRLVYIKGLIEEIENWLSNSVQVGIMDIRLADEKLSEIAEMIWFILAFWLLKNKILSKAANHELDFRGAVWNQLLPFFTESANIEYEAMILPKLSY